MKRRGSSRRPDAHFLARMRPCQSHRAGALSGVQEAEGNLPQQQELDAPALLLALPHALLEHIFGLSVESYRCHGENRAHGIPWDLCTHLASLMIVCTSFKDAVMGALKQRQDARIGCATSRDGSIHSWLLIEVQCDVMQRALERQDFTHVVQFHFSDECRCPFRSFDEFEHCVLARYGAPLLRLSTSHDPAELLPWTREPEDEHFERDLSFAVELVVRDLTRAVCKHVEATQLALHLEVPRLIDNHARHYVRLTGGHATELAALLHALPLAIRKEHAVEILAHWRDMARLVDDSDLSQFQKESQKRHLARTIAATAIRESWVAAAPAEDRQLLRVGRAIKDIGNVRGRHAALA